MLQLVAPQSESVKAGGETAEIVRNRRQADPVQVNELQCRGPGQVGEGIDHPRTSQEPKISVRFTEDIPLKCVLFLILLCLFCYC